MNATELSKFRDPDLFAAELHHWLNVEGLRSKWVLRLRRLARQELELDRIFETKVAEFKRALRENRKPTIWNLPVRAFEWLADNVQFTPRRDVVVTLVYVVIVLVFFEGLRSRLSFDPFFGSTPKRSVAYRDLDDLGTSFLPQSRGANSNAVSQIDQFFAEELKRAADSVGWKDLMMEQIANSISAFPVEPLLEEKLNAVVSSESFHSQLGQQIAKSLEAVQGDIQKQVIGTQMDAIVNELAAAIKRSEVQDHIAADVQEAVGRNKLADHIAAELGQKLKSLDLRPAIQAALLDSKGRLLEAVQAEMGSEVFRKEVAATVRGAVEAPEINERLRTSLAELANSVEFKSAFHENVRACLASEEFRKLIATSVHEILKVAGPAHAISNNKPDAKKAEAANPNTPMPEDAKPEAEKPVVSVNPAGANP